jgi:hypothetical protein
VINVPACGGKNKMTSKAKKIIILLPSNPAFHMTTHIIRFQISDFIPSLGGTILCGEKKNLSASCEFI